MLPLEAVLSWDIYYWFLLILYIGYIFVKCLNLLKIKIDLQVLTSSPFKV